MRTLPSGMLDKWTEGEFTGPENRPMARVTIQRLQIQLTKVDPEKLFASALFGQASTPVELPNVKNVSWDRSVGTDVATCTIVFYNTTPLPLGDPPVASGDLDLPGSYTFNYGATSWSVSRWGQATNQWQDLITPDRIIRTYEGYGFDAGEIPENDTHLVQTGTWMIDDVEFTHDGLITVTCRDIGRLLLDHIMFPPVIPLANYPLSFRKYFNTTTTTTHTQTGTVYRPTHETDSGVPYYGTNGSIYGHRPSHAFDSTGNSTYWLSVGNDRPNGPYSYEYIQGSVGGATVASIKFKVFGGPYRVFASIKQGGVWRGRSTIPYDPTNPVSAPNGANIHYIAVMNVGREAEATFTFGAYTSVESIRLTFTNLYNSGLGPFPYRAGVRDIHCSTASTSSTTSITVRHGEYGDYTEIVKYLLASGGFYWPDNTQAFYTLSDGSTVTDSPPSDDPYLTKGRVWGDLEMSGTAGPAELGVAIWDKKPLMDGIAYVRDILGFIFYVEETGGAIFRLPNVYKVGNYIGNNSTGAGYTSDILTIDEEQTLIGLRAKLSSRNIREHVFIANLNGKIGATAAGFNPVVPDPGLRRVAGWTDQNFETAKECQVMADLITVRQMFEYRSDTVTIVACPAIQIDDQVRIYERTTNEGYLHYVKGIRSNNDLESGHWTYDLTTNWLGENPGTIGGWPFDVTKLNAATQTYLATLGRI